MKTSLLKRIMRKKDTFSLPSTNNKRILAGLQAEIMALKEFVLSEVFLLKKETKDYQLVRPSKCCG